MIMTGTCGEQLMYCCVLHADVNAAGRRYRLKPTSRPSVSRFLPTFLASVDKQESPHFSLAHQLPLLDLAHAKRAWLKDDLQRTLAKVGSHS